MQQWKSQMSQLLAMAEDKAEMWEKIKHLDIDKALHDLDTLDEQIQAAEAAAEARVRSKELVEKRLRIENRQLRYRLFDETRVKTEAMSQLAFHRDIRTEECVSCMSIFHAVFIGVCALVVHRTCSMIRQCANSFISSSRTRVHAQGSGNLTDRGSRDAGRLYIYH
jgi:hypothetical protein